jgi:hypothetical protein
MNQAIVGCSDQTILCLLDFETEFLQKPIQQRSLVVNGGSTYLREKEKAVWLGKRSIL